MYLTILLFLKFDFQVQIKSCQLEWMVDWFKTSSQPLSFTFKWGRLCEYEVMRWGLSLLRLTVPRTWTANGDLVKFSSGKNVFRLVWVWTCDPKSVRWPLHHCAIQLLNQKCKFQNFVSNSIFGGSHSIRSCHYVNISVKLVDIS